MSKEYYIQNGWVGNAIAWWAERSEGYTTDIRKACRYTEKEAKRIVDSRKEDIAWPCDYIDNNEKAKKTIIDCQLADNSVCMRGKQK